MKVPYILIVGEKEQSTHTVSVREVKSKDQYEMPVDEFVGKCVQEYLNRL